MSLVQVNSAKRILFITRSLQGGGAERFVVNLLRHIDKNQFFPMLALVDKTGPYLSYIPCDIEVIDLRSKKLRYALPKIVCLVRKKKPDLVFSIIGYVNLGIALSRLFMPRGIKFVARETNIPTMNLRRSKFPSILEFLYRKLYFRFDRVICQSQDMYNDMLKNYGCSRNKLVIINNPVDAMMVDQKIQNGKRVFPEGIFNILAAGKLNYQKGFDLLLQSISRLKLSNFRLTILGKGPDEYYLKREALKLGVSGKVSFPGFVSNPYAYMVQADLFVLSSRFEGFPNVVLEAMACGTPVVAFDCPGGINEIVRDGINGWKVKPGDTNALANTIEKTLRTRWDIDLIKQSIESKFNSNKIAAEYEKVFMEVLKEQ